MEAGVGSSLAFRSAWLPAILAALLVGAQRALVASASLEARRRKLSSLAKSSRPRSRSIVMEDEWR